MLPPVPGGGVWVTIGVGLLVGTGGGVLSLVGTLFVSGVGIDVELLGVFAAVGLASPCMLQPAVMHSTATRRVVSATGLPNLPPERGCVNTGCYLFVRLYA